MQLRHTATRAGRLSSFLKGELKMSTGLMNKLKWGTAICVNGKPEHTDFAVVPGDVITVSFPDASPEYPAEDGNLTVLYEDDHLLAVDKPAGMLIHPSHSCNSGTLANLVQGYYRQTGQSCAFLPVTRLDRDTFGVVLLAKNAHVHHLLQKTKVKKTYYAAVFGEPKDDQGTINAPIARKPLPSLLREVHPEGKPSVTEYRVLKRDGKLCKLELRPVTGRTHQLRVHCSYMGWPILGDPQYGSEASREFAAAMGIHTQQLCAVKLEFFHPMTEEKMEICSRLDVSGI